MGDYFYKETVGAHLKGSDKAAIFLGELDPGTASIITGFLNTNELKQIRKSMKKISNLLYIWPGTTVTTKQVKAVSPK